MASQQSTEVLNETNDGFYENAEKYWSNVDPTVNGVLGGYGWISAADIRGSESFLNKIFKGKNAPARQRALDCGAGIGRVTKQLLLRYFDTVDLVEQNGTFLEEAKRYFGDEPKIGHYYECGLQKFEPSEKYDVIWCQWVLSHLTDEDLSQFLRRCAGALSPSGVIVIKENISSNGVIVDDVDSSMTRPTDDFIKVFRQSSLRVTRQAMQTNFPTQLFSVKLFCLSPESYNSQPCTVKLVSDLKHFQLQEMGATQPS